MKRHWFLGVTLLGLSFGVTAHSAIITVDENGNGIGTTGPGVIGNDTGPGGLNGVLTYTLPFAGVQGDVALSEGVGGLNLDFVRFNGDGTLIFYSDNVDGSDSLADTPRPPGIVYDNRIQIPEVGPEGLNGVTYTPTAGQPGFDASNPTYILISDGSAVPEPSTITLLGLGIPSLAVYAWRRRQRAMA